MTPSQAKLFAKVDDLEALASKARVVVATSDLGGVDFGRFVGLIPAIYSAVRGSDTKQQLQGVLASVSKTVDRLATSGDLGQGLLAGRVSEANFAGVLNAAGDTVATVLREADAASYSAGNLWEHVGAPTLLESKDLAERATREGQTVLGTVAVIAVALAVLYVTFQVTK